MTTKPLAVNLGIDVDGSVTEAMLMKAPKGESPAARWVRLAQLAIVQGCELVTVEAERGGSTRVAVTSGTKPGVRYLVNMGTMRCECEARCGCKHLAYVLACLGNLPDPATHVARSADAARPVSETLEVAA